jgi:hypothetical protein
MTVLIALLVISLFVRYLLPMVLRAVLGSFVRQQVHKAQQAGFYPPGGDTQAGYQSQNYQSQARQPDTAPGQVRVDYVPPTTAGTERKHEFRGGEYVDYEEVK